MHDIHVHLGHHEERVRIALVRRRTESAVRLGQLDRRAQRTAARVRLARLLSTDRPPGRRVTAIAATLQSKVASSGRGAVTGRRTVEVGARNGRCARCAES